MVLRGSVRALTYPYVHIVGDLFDERPSTPIIDAAIAPVVSAFFDVLAYFVLWRMTSALISAIRLCLYLKLYANFS